MPWLLILRIGVWVLGAGAIIGGFFWLRADAREDGRNEIRQAVAKVVAGQKVAVKDATIAALEKVHAENIRRLKLQNEAISKIGADCAVDPAVIDFIERLRQGPVHPGEGGDQ